MNQKYKDQVENKQGYKKLSDVFWGEVSDDTYGVIPLYFMPMQYKTMYSRFLWEKFRTCTEDIVQFLKDIIIPRDFAKAIHDGFYEELNLPEANNYEMIKEIQKCFRNMSFDQTQEIMMPIGDKVTLTWENDDIPGYINQWLITQFKTEMNAYLEDLKNKSKQNNGAAKEELKQFIDAICGNILSQKMQIKCEFLRLFDIRRIIAHTCFQSFDFYLGTLRAFVFVPLLYLKRLNKISVQDRQQDLFKVVSMNTLEVGEFLDTAAIDCTLKPFVIADGDIGTNHKIKQYKIFIGETLQFFIKQLINNQQKKQEFEVLLNNNDIKNIINKRPRTFLNSLCYQPLSEQQICFVLNLYFRSLVKVYVEHLFKTIFPAVAQSGMGLM
jgi:hypothetical protein